MGKKLFRVYACSTFSRTIPGFHDPTKKAFENIVGKGENADNQYFLLFFTMFSSLSKKEILISATLKLLSTNTFNLVKSKNFEIL